LFIFTLFVDVTKENENEDFDVSSRTLPLTLPLKKNNKRLIRRHEEHYDEKSKDTKISKIFQLAVTALSFLAFGGYLLTLIITAVRRNSGNGSGNGNVLIFSVIIIIKFFTIKLNIKYKKISIQRFF